MISYPIFLQEKSHWCVPACFQSILSSKGINVSQEEIAQDLKIKTGFDFNLEILTAFLEKCRLSFEFYNPFLGALESDLFLKETLGKKDIIVEREVAGRGHSSIITDYNSLNDLVCLQDPSQKELVSISLINLNNSILPRKNLNYGFYAIYDKK